MKEYMIDFCLSLGPQKQTLRQESECRELIWKVVSGNVGRVVEAEIGESPNKYCYEASSL
jgi:hypothetical protein